MPTSARGSMQEPRKEREKFYQQELTRPRISLSFSEYIYWPNSEREKKRRRREVDMKRERKKERDVSASTPSSVINAIIWLMMALTPKRLFLSFSLSSCLPLFSAFFSRAHYWVNKYILKNACELQRVVLYFKDIFEFDSEPASARADHRMQRLRGPNVVAAAGLLSTRIRWSPFCSEMTGISRYRSGRRKPTTTRTLVRGSLPSVASSTWWYEHRFANTVPLSIISRLLISQRLQTRRLVNDKTFWWQLYEVSLAICLCPHGLQLGRQRVAFLDAR